MTWRRKQRGAPHYRLPAGQEIGYGFSRGSTQRISMRSVRIVIELKEYNGKPYYILTTFPTP
ncbi:RNase A-like domain-containing protein [Enterobacter cloacae]|uniref:RNase A-like domain-containing protein n=1 Tax=Enterobacter cloacae TaxID=550 RepID=UPI003BAD1062